MDAYLRGAGKYERLSAEAEHEALVELGDKRVARWQALLGHPFIARLCVDWLRKEAEAASDLDDLQPALNAVDEGWDGLAEQMRVCDRGRGDELAREVLSLLDGRSADLGTIEESEVSARERVTYRARLDTADAEYRAARNEFTCRNLKLVVSLASRFDNRRRSLADLVQDGNLGLIEAVERFDPDRGTRFSTYAAWWIRHRMTSALTNRARLVRVPVHLHRAFMKARRLAPRLRSELGREPTSEELAELVGVKPRTLARARRALERRVVPLDAPSDSAERSPIAEVLPADGVDIEAALDDRRISQRVEHGFDDLDQRAQHILRHRFGLDGVEPQTLKSLGGEFGVSRERVRQLQNRALGKLRAAAETSATAAA